MQKSRDILFSNNGVQYYLNNAINLFNKKVFIGWGRKRTGRFASWCHNCFGGTLSLLEDGFIRSLGLGVEGSPSFSIVEDDVGIYYDATAPSRLENILNTYDFSSDSGLMNTACEAMAMIREHRISKYNHASDAPEGFFGDGSRIEPGMTRRVLIVAQTAGDASLIYGMGNHFTTDQMIDAAIAENPDATVYLKIHPDVLSGKKGSDIDIEKAAQKCIIIDQDINPISLMEYFDTVYTKTSQMGFEALIVGKKCVCFGMPFYAGWGITDDRVSCERRNRKLSTEEVFAAAYILYAHYYNPYRNRTSDILDTIEEIVRQRKKNALNPKYNILALGDSHTRIFKYRISKYLFPRKTIKVFYVPGATATGIKNIHSKTGAYTKFLDVLEEYNYNKIIVTLGEVDTAYTIWKRSELKGISVEELMENAAENYKSFLLLLLKYAPVTVISASLPTVDDNADCDDSISGIRKVLKIPRVERTKLALKFNDVIKTFCQQQRDIHYIDLDKIILSRKGVVKKIFLDPKNRCEHHYWHVTFGLLLRWKLRDILKKEIN